MKTKVSYVKPKSVTQLAGADKGCLYRIAKEESDNNLVIPIKHDVCLNVNPNKVLVLRNYGDNWVVEEMGGYVIVCETYEVAEIRVEGTLIDN
ncbi:TPA: hypothetical protein JRS25_004144 [Escherichia coli]|nr:hypothetical protein [Escherichia coli]